MFRTSQLPRPGETLFGHGFQTGFGGKGANQAVMAAKLGAQVTIIAKVGRDVFGAQTIANLRHEGVDADHVLIDDEQPTGVAAIVVDSQGQNAIIVVPGANGGLTPADIERASLAIQAANVVVCQLEVPIETVVETFRVAKAVGLRTILNPAPARELSDELLHLTDICVPNETELELLTGLGLASREAVHAAALQLSKRGPATIIITLGSDGALLVEGDKHQHFPAQKVSAADTTGAGDAFIGSLAVFLVEGLPMAEAIRWANAAAALSVTRLGIQASFPNRDEMQSFLK